MISTTFEIPANTEKLPPQLFPSPITLDNIIWIINSTLVVRYYINTLIVTLASTFFAMVSASMAGYSLSRFKFRGRTTYSLYLFVAQMLPPTMSLIPLFYVLSKLSLTNSYPGLTLLYITFSLPFCTWMMKGYFDSIPQDIEESAMVDGASRLTAFYRVILPLALPGLGAVAIWSFLMGWQEYIFSLTIMIDENMKTLTVALYSLAFSEYLDWGKVMAYCTLFCVPAFILFAFVQKYLIQGLTSGAVKG